MPLMNAVALAVVAFVLSSAIWGVYREHLFQDRRQLRRLCVLAYDDAAAAGDHAGESSFGGRAIETDHPLPPFNGASDLIAHTEARRRHFGDEHIGPPQPFEIAIVNGAIVE